MINIKRGVAPSELILIEKTEIARLRLIKPTPNSDDVGAKYRSMSDVLWKMQNLKCCYCEIYIAESYNDVEHYRPKGRADRLPGSTDTHGYWWLAFEWNNLLFACPGCNRSAKNDLFPLSIGSMALLSEEIPPTNEKPLLINPTGTINPVEHIEFKFHSQKNGIPKQWIAFPRRKSDLGLYTIMVCKLNRPELIELRAKHFSSIIQPQIDSLRRNIARNDCEGIKWEFERALAMTAPTSSFAALTYDVFRKNFHNAEMLKLIGKSWPSPSSACR